MAKVMLISPPFCEDFARNVRWPAKTKARILRPPDFLAYATAVLEKDNHKVALVDMIANGQNKEDLGNMVQYIQPDFVVLDTSTPSIYSDLDCAKIVKSFSSAKVIMVGPHVSALPNEDYPNVDHICVGEYDLAVKDIVDGKADRIVSHPIDDLDDLPSPAWEHLNLFDYFDGGRLYPYLDIYTGRGCVNHCSFCAWPQTMFGHKYRLRSIKKVIDEIQYALFLFPELKRGEFFIEDDSFTSIPSRVKEFCDEIEYRGLKITWSANVRVNTSYDTLYYMKKAGCRCMSVGFESGSQKILDNVNKGAYIEQSRNFMFSAKRAGIDVHACFIIGLPGETKESCEETLNFAFELDPTTVQFALATPLPGTEFYRWCKINNYLKAKDWSEWGSENQAIIEYPGLSAEMMNYYADKGMKDFYLRPKFILNYLTKSRDRHDLYRKLRSAWSYLSYLKSR